MGVPSRSRPEEDDPLPRAERRPVPQWPRVARRCLHTLTVALGGAAAVQAEVQGTPATWLLVAGVLVQVAISALPRQRKPRR
jgi:hypothetical protein